MFHKHIICVLFITCAWCLVTNADELSDGQKPTACGEVGDCLTIDTDCKERCGCDKTIPTHFDNKTQECVINNKFLILSLKEEHNTADYDMSLEDDMATKIEAEADRIFQGIFISALLFISCASVCVLSACIYCCRMNYADYRLKKSVKELAKKVGAKPELKRPTVKPTTKPMSESCNVVVEDAGVFCV